MMFINKDIIIIIIIIIIVIIIIIIIITFTITITTIMISHRILTSKRAKQIFGVGVGVP